MSATAVYAVAAAIVATLVILQPLPVPAREDDLPPEEEYRKGISLGMQYFHEVYGGEFAPKSRATEILKKCGYKKEAQELETLTMSSAHQKLNELVKESKSNGVVLNGASFLLASQTALGLLMGYSLGFGESFSMFSDLLAARTYDDICKSSLAWISTDRNSPKI
jgi:hypothetical protein